VSASWEPILSTLTAIACVCVSFISHGMVHHVILIVLSGDAEEKKFGLPAKKKRRFEKGFVSQPHRSLRLLAKTVLLDEDVLPRYLYVLRLLVRNSCAGNTWTGPDGDPTHRRRIFRVRIVLQQCHGHCAGAGDEGFHYPPRFREHNWPL
jgi:hypothetical protein